MRVSEAGRDVKVPPASDRVFAVADAKEWASVKKNVFKNKLVILSRGNGALWAASNPPFAGVCFFFEKRRSLAHGVHRHDPTPGVLF